MLRKTSKYVTLSLIFLICFCQVSIAHSAVTRLIVSTQPDGSEENLRVKLKLASEIRSRNPDQTIVIAIKPGRINLHSVLDLSQLGSAGRTTLKSTRHGSTLITGVSTALRDDNIISELVSPVQRLLLGKYLRGFTLNPDRSHGKLRAYDPLYPGAGLLLFQNDNQLLLSHWPNSGFFPAGMADELKNTLFSFDVTPGLREEVHGLTRVWAAGYWNTSYDFERSEIAGGFDSTLKALAVKTDGSRSHSAKFSIFNSERNLGQTNTFISDIDNTRVVVNLSEPGPVVVADLELLLQIHDAKRITVEGIIFSRSGGDGIRVEKSDKVNITDCVVDTTARTGIVAQDSTNIKILRTAVLNTGEAGIKIMNSDRKSLVSTNNRIVHSVILKYGQILRSYQPGILLAGVGHKVSGTLIAFGAHDGMILFGNNHQVVGNEFYRTNMDGGDAGALYMGRDWTQRGNLIEYNIFSNIGPEIRGTEDQTAAIYLDDFTSGTVVNRNLILNSINGIVLGGGRDNVVTDNLLIDSAERSIQLDDRGDTWAKSAVIDPHSSLRAALASGALTNGAYIKAYRHLANILSDDPGTPKYNQITNNWIMCSPPVNMPSFPNITNTIYNHYLPFTRVSQSDKIESCRGVRGIDLHEKKILSSLTSKSATIKAVADALYANSAYHEEIKKISVADSGLHPMK